MKKKNVIIWVAVIAAAVAALTTVAVILVRVRSRQNALRVSEEECETIPVTIEEENN